MTLDEAIQHSKEVAKKERDKLLKVGDEYICSECGKEHEQLAEWLEELKEYKELEKKGLLLKLPYNIANHGIVYFVDEKDLEIYQLRSDKIEISKMMISNEFYYTIDSFDFYYEDFGKTVFLTKEEAKKELERLENESKRVSTKI